MGTDSPGRITVVGTTVCIGLLLMAAGAWSSYSQWRVAESIGMIGPLRAALPMATDVMVVVATIISLSPHFTRGVSAYAQCIAIGGGFFSVGIGALHSLLPDQITSGWGWAKFVVSGVPPICMGLAIHLVAMIHVRDRATPTSALPVHEPAQETTPVIASAEVAKPPVVPSRVPGRPEWLQEGMNAKEAMFAYLDRCPETKGAELDRVVGKPYFNTVSGYGRKTRAEWQIKTGWRSETAIGE